MCHFSKAAHGTFAHHVALSADEELNFTRCTFPARRPTKDPRALNTHRWIPTLKPGQKGSQPKLLSDSPLLLHPMVLSPGSSSQTGPDGSYSRPHGAGRVHNRATIVLNGFKKRKEKTRMGRTTPRPCWQLAPANKRPLLGLWKKPAEFMGSFFHLIILGWNESSRSH